MLQRLTEDLEYSELLDKAAACEISAEQMCYVAAFTTSSYSTTSTRTGKPFNPLLGETFEFDRTEDLGWRSLAEQVKWDLELVRTRLKQSEIVRENILQGQGKVRGFYFEKGKIDFLKKSQGKLKQFLSYS